MAIHVKVRGKLCLDVGVRSLSLLRSRFKIFPSPLHDPHMFTFMIILPCALQ